MSSSTSRNDSGKRWYSHTQWEMTSTGYWCPLYDSDALPTNDPPSLIDQKIIPPVSQRDSALRAPTPSALLQALHGLLAVAFADLRRGVFGPTGLDVHRPVRM
jgi:hypothetical protein